MLVYNSIGSSNRDVIIPGSNGIIIVKMKKQEGVNY
jgi:hypothetical protein